MKLKTFTMKFSARDLLEESDVHEAIVNRTLHEAGQGDIDFRFASRGSISQEVTQIEHGAAVTIGLIVTGEE